MLNHRPPSVFYIAARLVSVMVAELNFFVLFLGAIDHATGIRIDKFTAGIRDAFARCSCYIGVRSNPRHLD